jgi:hypothetical protein
MRVFVTGTGRCGTTTFAKACSHITNFTSGHETKRQGSPQADILEFPDNHIEVDAHLFWHMGALMWKYPDAYWVHLRRGHDDCVRSLMKTSGIKDWIRLAYGPGNVDLQKACSDYYLSTNRMIEMCLEMSESRRYMHLEKLEDEWYDFWEWIGADGDYGPAVAELAIRHNAR